MWQCSQHFIPSCYKVANIQVKLNSLFIDIELKSTISWNSNTSKSWQAEKTNFFRWLSCGTRFLYVFFLLHCHSLDDEGPPDSWDSLNLFIVFTLPTLYLSSNNSSSVFNFSLFWLFAPNTKTINMNVPLMAWNTSSYPIPVLICCMPSSLRLFNLPLNHCQSRAGTLIEIWP